MTESVKKLRENFAQEMERFRDSDLTSLNGFKDNMVFHIGYLDMALFQLMGFVRDLEERVQSLEAKLSPKASGGPITAMPKNTITFGPTTTGSNNFIIPNPVKVDIAPVLQKVIEDANLALKAETWLPGNNTDHAGTAETETGNT